jgi:disulfide oxidoreductase YuzD
MKQTAVEWLVETLNKKYGNDDFIITFINEIEQAKEMEKKIIIDSWNDGAYGSGQFTETHDNSEQYYNETFKQL